MANNIETLVEKYSDMIIKIAYQNCFNKSDSEDIVQEVFIKIIKGFQEIESEEHMKSWIIRITINTCKDYNKMAWYKKVDTINEKDVPYDFESDDNEILKHISKLKPIQRNIIYLYYYEGYKINEISKIMDLNENTVSSNLTRARKKIREILEVGGEIYA